MSNQAPTSGSIPLRDLIREDWQTHNRQFSSPGLHALLVHRLQVAAEERRGLAGKIARRVLGLINSWFIRNVYGIEIYPTTQIGRRLLIGHHMGVILGSRSVIGDDCLVRQHVTLGMVDEDPTAQPTIGNGVRFGPGSTVAGPVHVGDGAIIGPHALVFRNVPAGATAMGAPARLLPKTDSP